VVDALPDVVHVSAGKGRGVVATKDLEPGDLLMVCPPLAVIRGQAGADIPEPDELVEHILQVRVGRQKRGARTIRGAGQIIEGGRRTIC
jgi:hypothetical protein